MYYQKIWLFLGQLYILFIFSASLLTVPEVNINIAFLDKIVHFLLYFLLVGWFIQLYPQSHSKRIIVIAAISMGMLIEILQGMTLYRSFELADELANSIGAISAFTLDRSGLIRGLNSLDGWLYHWLNH